MQDLHLLDIMSSSDWRKNEIDAIDSQKETGYEWNLFIVTAPSSITELFTEERQQGKAYFRAGRIGDISHLTTAGLKPSFASRFCEVYSNMEQRH